MPEPDSGPAPRRSEPHSAVSGMGWGFPVSLIVLPRRAGQSRALLRRVATRCRCAPLLTARPATEKRRLPGNPQRNGTDVHRTSGGLSDPPGSSGAATPSIRADESVHRGRDPRQIATRSSHLSVRRPSGVAVRRKGRQDRHPGPVGASNRYALLPFRRPATAWGRCPHQRATELASGAARRVRSLRASLFSASGGRLGLIPAPNDEQSSIRACGRVRSLRAAEIPASDGRPWLLAASKADPQSIPAQDGRQPPRFEERVAI